MPSEELLEKYAEVAIKVGVGLQEGDRLLIRSSVEAIDLTRRVVEKAYEAGAVNVEVLWSDDAISRARFTKGSEEASQVVSGRAEFNLRALETGDLFLTIMAEDPDAFAGVDVARLGAFQKANGEFLEPLARTMGSLQRNWSIIAAPTPAWATKVFPKDEADVAVEKLWESIFNACRVSSGDPVAEWEDHMRSLDDRRRYLNGRGYVSLRYAGPGTDLTLGLPNNALWVGGNVATPEGRPFAPNIPTEEVFTSPHRLEAEGSVRATKPLSLFGNLVDGFSLEVSEGKIVGAVAEKGQEVLDQLLATDEGSMRFGEAAMVPMSSAVAAEGLVWNNVLYDENDGCHIAIGRAYPTCVQGGTDMSPDEALEAGLNMSTAHVDFVVGSPDLTVYGLRSDGAEEPIIANGEWAFDA